MIETQRGLSYVAYSYDGGPLRFTCTFPFLKKEHVRVLVGDPASPRTVLGQWIDATTIEIPDQSEYLKTPFTVVLRRYTPFKAQAIRFQDSALLPARQLNTAVQQLLYVQQELTEFGLDGNGIPGSGLPGGGGGSMPDIETIVNQVVQSPAYQKLTERIAEIDANAELIMEETLRSNAFFDMRRDYGSRISEAVHRLTLTETALETVAEEYTSLLARMGTQERETAAQFLEVNQAVANETEARVTALTDLHAQIKTETDTIVGQAVKNVEVKVTDVEARVDAVDGTVAGLGDSLAATNEKLSTVATEAEASTEWRQLFSAQFGGDGSGTSIASAVKQQIDTKATPAEAQAIANTSVSAFANGTFAALQQSYNAYVSANDGRWSTTWALRVNGGDPARPVVAGISLSAGDGGSDFVVNADRFAFTTGSDYTNRRFPFVIGTVGGLSTVGVNGQLLVDGSITANKLTVNSLSAITANAGTINGGTFKTHTLDQYGNVVNALEFRFEASNVGNWPLWIGSGVKNENNAIFWVDRAGNAGFKGKVSAPNIVGQFQVSNSINWRGGTAISYWDGSINGHRAVEGHTEIGVWWLAQPLLPGEVHIPHVSIMLTTNRPAPGLEVVVQELQGGTWIEIGRHSPSYQSQFSLSYGGSGEVVGYSLEQLPVLSSKAVIVAVGSATTAARAFRVLARYYNLLTPLSIPTSAGRPVGWGDVTVVEVSGFVQGVR